MDKSPMAFVKQTVIESAWHFDVLKCVRAQNLPDWAIGAGFVRNLIWDRLHGFDDVTPLNDIDVIYFDAGACDGASDARIEARLRRDFPDVPWSVKNQARMHVANGDAAYRDTCDAVAYWLETPTAICVRLDYEDRVHLCAPHGLEDLLGLRVRPTPAGRRKAEQYNCRVMDKGWQEIWPKLDITRVADR